MRFLHASRIHLARINAPRGILTLAGLRSVFRPEGEEAVPWGAEAAIVASLRAAFGRA